MSVHVSFSADATRASIVFSHPTGNILTLDVIHGLRATLSDLAEEEHLRLVTLEGAGDDFSFGASIPEHTADVIQKVLPETHALIVDLLELPAPTAAVVRGRCLGGGFELALACDLIFAADDATFALPEIALGVFPPAASVLLPRRVGYGRASVAILTGERQPASYWQDAGLIERVVPRDRLTAEISAWCAERLTPHSAAALRHATRALRAPLIEAVRTELPAVERLYLRELMQSHDANEGVAAFLAKRPPAWKDR